MKCRVTIHRANTEPFFLVDANCVVLFPHLLVDKVGNQRNRIRDNNIPRGTSSLDTWLIVRAAAASSAAAAAAAATAAAKTALAIEGGKKFWSWVNLIRRRKTR